MSWKNSKFGDLLVDFSKRATQVLHVNGVLTSAKAWFHPESASGIRRLQFFWAACLGLITLGLSYGIIFFLFDNPPVQKQIETPKLTPKTIETASQKVNLDEVRWYKVEEENKKLSEEITSLKTFVQEQLALQKNMDESEDLDRDLETNIHHIETDLKSPEDERGEQDPHQELETLSNLAASQQNEASFQGEERKETPIIQKFSLSLSDKPKNKLLKTIETTIPAGAFAKTILLSGLDASSAMNASSDPRPMLLRLIDPGTLPRRFQSDLKDCHCTASAFGDLSSERIYARLEKLTCIERSTGEIVETQVAGYIAGGDGKAGIRGIVASKDGQFLSRSLMGGVFAGLSNVANPQSRQSQVNPFYPGNQKASPPSMGEMFTSGMAGGVTSALDRLSQYYIDRAEQLQPIIQVSAGQVVDIVFTEGTSIGSQSVHAEIEAQRASIQKKEGE